MTVRRLLVANRGEIARRVFRTCRDLGIETVAVHSDADAHLPFVREADVAVRLPGSAPADTYLRADLLVAAARDAGADAVHPGYGFLSENADFARQVLAAGLTWVGPAPEAIEQMGSKVRAKELVAAAGVPVLAEVAPAAVTEADLPLLVKASAGGGGRGMRVVRSLEEVRSAVDLAAAEAASAFGDATVFCEPYVEHGRHVEVQILADGHGGLAVLGERDCSVQRRHQKVLEETPAPGLPDGTRSAMHDAARLVAATVDYVGAGTVEFLYEPGTGRFSFLEMNTRLQVEHPVTECVTGVDLVAAQIAVAEGRSVREIPGVSSGEVAGHAVEARIYAEDPVADWQPQSGRLTRFDIPGVAAEFAHLPSYGVRLDSGFRAGDEVGTYYDAMLAKVVAWAPTREQAVRRLAATLERAQIHGVRTNRDLLVNVLRDEDFVDGQVATDFFARHDLARLAAGPADPAAVRLSAFAAAVVLAERAQAERPVQHGVAAGWRNVTSQPHRSRFVRAALAENSRTSADESGLVEVGWYGGRGGYRSADLGARATDVSSSEAVVVDGSRRSVRFEVHVEQQHVDVESVLGHVALRRLPRFTDPAAAFAPGSLLAPMPGTVVAVAVEAGADVRAGDPVLVLEAMKMQHTVRAPDDGVVSELPVKAGDQVAAGTVLAVVAVGGTGEAGASEGEGT
jgi:propionyl-CoA carboxylase alpha chain